MAFMYRVRVTLGGWPGAPGLSTTYHRASAIPLASEALTCATRVRGAWDVFKSAMATSQTADVQPTVDVLNDADGELVDTFTIAAPARVSGTVVGSIGPPQVMCGLVLGTSTIVNGRRLRGRLYLGPLTSGSTNTSGPAGGLVTAAAAFGVALITIDPASASQPALVWHRPRAATPTLPAALGSSALITGTSVAPKWFTLRSRLN